MGRQITGQRQQTHQRSHLLEYIGLNDKGGSRLAVIAADDRRDQIAAPHFHSYFQSRSTSDETVLEFAHDLDLVAVRSPSRLPLPRDIAGVPPASKATAALRVSIRSRINSRSSSPSGLASRSAQFRRIHPSGAAGMRKLTISPFGSAVVRGIMLSRGYCHALCNTRRSACNAGLATPVALAETAQS